MGGWGGTTLVLVVILFNLKINYHSDSNGQLNLRDLTSNFPGITGIAWISLNSLVRRA